MDKRVMPWGYLFPAQWKVLKLFPEIRWHIHTVQKRTLLIWAFRAVTFTPLMALFALHVAMDYLSAVMDKTAERIQSLGPKDNRSELVKEAWGVVPLDEIKARLSTTSIQRGV